MIRIQEILQSQTANKSVELLGRATQQSRDTRNTNKAKQQALSLFPIKMIAKLERIQNNAQQNIEKLQNSTMGATINNKSTTAEQLP